MRSVAWLTTLAATLVAPACAGPAPQATNECQVIVGFAGATDGPAPATLARLARTGGAGVAFVSSLSPRSHAYRLTCPPDDPACARAIKALKADPSIQYLEIDHPKDSR